MSPPRFMPVHGSIVAGVSVPSWPSRDAPGTQGHPSGPWLSWRLVGSNNRELGRDVDIYRTPAECLAAIAYLRARLGDAVPVLLTHENRWNWQLVVDRRRVATSARAYQRQRESRHIAEQFVAAVPLAVISESLTADATWPGRRAQRPAVRARPQLPARGDHGWYRAG